MDYLRKSADQTAMKTVKLEEEIERLRRFDGGVLSDRFARAGRRRPVGDHPRRH